MILTQTEKTDWELILSTIPPYHDGETDEEKTARFDAHVRWLTPRVYRLQKAAKDLGNLRDKRSFAENASAFKSAAGHFVRRLEEAVASLGDDAAQYAFKNAVRFALERLEEEGADA